MADGLLILILKYRFALGNMLRCTKDCSIDGDLGMQLEECLKKYAIGLTGGVASGKSTVAKILRGLGYTVYDADALSREAVSPGSNALARIVAEFGGKVLNQDGSLDRKAMRSIVFGQAEKRRHLENIVHPAIQQALEKKVRESGLMDAGRYWFYEAALLFEVSKQQRFRQVWVCYCDLDTQLKRLMARDQIESELAIKMVESQWPLSKKADMADLVIDTKGPISALEPRVIKATRVLTSGKI